MSWQMSIFFVSLLVSFISVPAVIWIARKRKLFAVPGSRHIHKLPTPKLGGVAIALGVFAALLLILPKDRFTISYLISSMLMVSLGVVDDIRESKWGLKLLVSLAAISILIFGGDIWIRTIGNLFGGEDIELGLWGIPFTYFAVFGIINAINLIDGLNGLACGVSTIAFSAFAILAYSAGKPVAFYLSLANLGGILGLFRYNYPKASIFMGDSGSLFIGFSLSALAMRLTQHGTNAIDPMIPVVILALPIFDTVRVMVVRMLHGRHPFQADKTHIHHLMMRSGTAPLHVVRLIWVLSVTIALFAFAMKDMGSWVLLIAFTAIVALLSLSIENLRIVRLKKVR